MFLDEMLDSLPRPAFASAAAAEAQRRQEEEDEEAAADLERLCGEADGYEQIRSRRREQQAARDFAMRFIAEYRGKLPTEQLLRRLDVESAANAAKVTLTLTPTLTLTLAGGRPSFAPEP